MAKQSNRGYFNASFFYFATANNQMKRFIEGRNVTIEQFRCLIALDVLMSLFTPTTPRHLAHFLFSSSPYSYMLVFKPLETLRGLNYVLVSKTTNKDKIGRHSTLQMTLEGSNLLRLFRIQTTNYYQKVYKKPKSW